MQAFLTQVHPSIPLFDQRTCLQILDGQGFSPVLRSTVAAIAAATLSQCDVTTKAAACTYLEEALHHLLLDRPTSPNQVRLDDFQLTCLLTYYDFHQRPGYTSWMRIGSLVRQAYGMGLHEIDADAESSFQRNSSTVAQLEAWRRLWWFLYCLDSYSNITSAMPCMIEQDTIRTCLPLLHLDGSSCPRYTPVTIAYENVRLWETVKSLPTCDQGHHFDVHIIMTSLVREAATVYRYQRVAPKRPLSHRINQCEDALVATRLALPAHYQSVIRSPWSGESVMEYHARLINLIMQYTADLVTISAVLVSQDACDDPSIWDRMLNVCGEIVTAVKHLDCTQLTAIDPAICFVFSTVLAILHLYSVCRLAPTNSGIDETLRSTIERQKRILLLFLENFSAHWFLPRFLIGNSP